MILKSRNFLIHLVISLIFIQLLINPNTSLASISKLQVQYLVKSTDNQTNTWYNETYHSFHYKVIKNSEVNVTIDNISNFNSNLTIEIGNLTRTNINDSEADFNLGFGYYKMPYSFGFVANTSWNILESNLKSYVSKSSFANENSKFLGGSTNVVSIQFQDGTAQNTTLIYNKENGLLLYAKSEIFGFLLELTILSVNNNTLYYSTSSKLDLIFNLFPVLILLAFLGRRRRKYN